MKITCCEKCALRSPGCHGTCREYSRQRDALRAENETRYKQLCEDHDYCEAVRFKTARLRLS